MVSADCIPSACFDERAQRCRCTYIVYLGLRSRFGEGSGDYERVVTVSKQDELKTRSQQTYHGVCGGDTVGIHSKISRVLAVEILYWEIWYSADNLKLPQLAIIEVSSRFLR